MKLIQFFLPGKGPRVGLLRGDQVVDITRTQEGVCSTLDLLRQGKTAAGLRQRAEWLARTIRRPALEYRELQRSPSRRAPHLLIPVEPPEVWAVRPPDEPARPAAVFFKATASRCAGPQSPLSTRPESRLPLPRPGVGAVLSDTGAILALTGYLGISAQDMLGHPLGVSRAETHDACCALGPCLVTPDDFGEIDRLQMRLALVRDGAERFSEPFLSSPLAALSQPVPALLDGNACPSGTVLAVEMGTCPPASLALADGDRLQLEIQGIGRLSHPVRRGSGVGGPGVGD